MMKEKLQEYALFAEINSSIAILATLLILIFEMRENTEAIKSSNLQSLAERTQQLTLNIAMNPDLAKVAQSFRSNGKEVSESEILEAQQRAYVLTRLKLGEEAFIQYRSGLLQEEYWGSRAEFAISTLSNERALEIYETSNKESYSAEYIEWLNQAIEERYGL